MFAYVILFVCAYIYIYIHTYIYMHVYLYTYIHIYTYTYKYIHTCTYSYIGTDGHCNTTPIKNQISRKIMKERNIKKKRSRASATPRAILKKKKN